MKYHLHKLLTHPVFQLRPDRDVDALLDSPISDSLASIVSTSNTGNSLNNFPGLKYPTPQLSPTLLSDAPSPESVKPEPLVDPIEEEQDLSHVELAEHLNKLLVDDKRFFGLSRSAHTFKSLVRAVRLIDLVPIYLHNIR